MILLILLVLATVCAGQQNSCAETPTSLILPIPTPFHPQELASPLISSTFTATKTITVLHTIYRVQYASPSAARHTSFCNSTATATLSKPPTSSTTLSSPSPTLGVTTRRKLEFFGATTMEGREPVVPPEDYLRRFYPYNVVARSELDSGEVTSEAVFKRNEEGQISQQPTLNYFGATTVEGATPIILPPDAYESAITTFSTIVVNSTYQSQKFIQPIANTAPLAVSAPGLMILSMFSVLNVFYLFI